MRHQDGERSEGQLCPECGRTDTTVAHVVPAWEESERVVAVPSWVPAPIGTPRSDGDWANEFVGRWSTEHDRGKAPVMLVPVVVCACGWTPPLQAWEESIVREMAQHHAAERQHIVGQGMEGAQGNVHHSALCMQCGWRPERCVVGLVAMARVGMAIHAALHSVAHQHRS